MHQTHCLIIHEAVTLVRHKGGLGSVRCPEVLHLIPALGDPLPFPAPRHGNPELIINLLSLCAFFLNPVSHCLPIVTGPGREGSECLGLRERRKAGPGNRASRTDHTPTTWNVPGFCASPPAPALATAHLGERDPHLGSHWGLGPDDQLMVETPTGRDSGVPGEKARLCGRVRQPAPLERQ